MHIEIEKKNMTIGLRYDIIFMPKNINAYGIETILNQK